MLICVFGMPSALTYWAGHVIRVVASVAIGEFHYFEPLEIDALKAGVASRNQRPIVLFSDSPDAGIRNAITQSGAHILTLYEELTDVVGYAQVSRKLEFIQSVRFTTHCLSCLHDLYFYRNSDFVRRQDLTTVADFVDRLDVLYGFGLSDEKKAIILHGLQGDQVDPRAVPIEENIRNLLPLARPPGGFDEDLRAQGDASLFDMLEEYSIVRDRKPMMGINWPRAAFLDGDNPGSAPPPQIDITGRSRHVFFGPYMHVPPGQWTATIAFSVAENISGNRMTFDVGEQGKPIAMAQVDLPVSGRYKISLDFDINEPRRFVEVRGMLMFGAIEGWFSLLWVKIVRRTRQAGGEPERLAG